MRAGERGFARAIIAIEINAVLVFAGVAHEAAGIETRDDEQADVAGPVIFLEQAEDRERAGGFIAVHAAGNVKMLARVGGDFLKRRQARARKFERDKLPIVPETDFLDIAQQALDIDRLALV